MMKQEEETKICFSSRYVPNVLHMLPLLIIFLKNIKEGRDDTSIL